MISTSIGGHFFEGTAQKGSVDLPQSAQQHSNRSMNVRRAILRTIPGLMILFCGLANAVPLRLFVRPYGTNQVELTFGPVLADTAYLVLVRTNDPSGHWLNFLAAYGDSNRTMSVIGNLAPIKGLSLQTLNH